MDFGLDFAASRLVMVDSQVRVNDVTDHALQRALLAVPRERFCAPERAFSAYAEVDVPIAGDRKLMQARDVAKLMQALDARPGERALAIAAPYAAAVLADMDLSVTAQEADQAVFDIAGDALTEAGVKTVVAPLNQPTSQDWDLIISEGAVAERPQAWLDALRDGGRAVFVERNGPTGEAVLYERGRGGLSRRVLFDSAPTMLTGFEARRAFAL